MRLVNGASASEGRVEIFYEGQWGTVCDNLWNLLDAQVVCRALGYENATQALGRAAFGPGMAEVPERPLLCRPAAPVPTEDPVPAPVTSQALVLYPQGMAQSCWMRWNATGPRPRWPTAAPWAGW